MTPRGTTTSLCEIKLFINTFWSLLSFTSGWVKSWQARTTVMVQLPQISGFNFQPSQKTSSEWRQWPESKVRSRALLPKTQVTCQDYLQAFRCPMNCRARGGVAIPDHSAETIFRADPAFERDSFCSALLERTSNSGSSEIKPGTSNQKVDLVISFCQAVCGWFRFWLVQVLALSPRATHSLEHFSEGGQQSLLRNGAVQAILRSMVVVFLALFIFESLFTHLSDFGRRGSAGRGVQGTGKPCGEW